MSAERYIVLAAGGTGGHMFPALSLGHELEQRGNRVSLLTDQRGQQYLTEVLTMDVQLLASGSPSRGGPIGIISSVIGIFKGTIRARDLFKKAKPDLVVGFGGYSALPAMLAARLTGVPVVIHEQNAVLGRANRLIANKARLIALSFENTSRIEKSSRTQVVGNPVRAKIIALREKDYTLPEADGSINILVMGGSQGATIFSALVPDAISLLPNSLRTRIRISQHSRKEDLDDLKARYKEDNVEADIFAFGPDISTKLARAHLIISRAGGGTISELGVSGRPAILIPLPTALDDHQTANAHVLADAGGGWLMPESGLDAPALANRLVELLEQPNQLGLAALDAKSTGRPDAHVLFADLIEKLMSGNSASDDASDPERREAA